MNRYFSSSEIWLVFTKKEILLVSSEVKATLAMVTLYIYSRYCIFEHYWHLRGSFADSGKSLSGACCVTFPPQQRDLL